MPSASSTSADPDFDDAERLPCLTTRAPAPAATIADIVEMLTDMDRSPPVPTTSSSRPGTEIGLAAASIASAMPVTSSTVSPLARSATTSPVELDGRRRAGEDLVHGPSRLLGRQVVAGDQRGEDVGPGVGHGDQASAAAVPRPRGVRRWPAPTVGAGR